MREIKFRGKALSNGQWVEGHYVRFRDYPVIVPENIDGFNVHWNQVDPATVGEFTGLHDKNGKEICEGDILAGHDDGNVAVTWRQDGWFCEFGDKNAISLGEMAIWFGPRATVIGNVYEQADLLEVQP